MLTFFSIPFFFPLPPFPSITSRIKMNSVSSCWVWVGFFLFCWGVGFFEGFFKILHSLVSVLPAQFVIGNVPSELNDALLRLSPVELYWRVFFAVISPALPVFKWSASFRGFISCHLLHCFDLDGSDSGRESSSHPLHLPLSNAVPDVYEKATYSS